jgi:RND family efflux transporter MFP subunit
MFSRSKRLPMAASIAILALSLSGCGKPAVSTEPVAKVAYFNAIAATSSGASYTGVVHARTESNLGFRIAGKILQRLVDPGDSVKAGQPLMKLDPVDYELATTASRALVQAAKARDVQASSDEARLRKLLETGAVSKQAYEQVKAAADSAAAQLEAARSQSRQTENQADYAILRADVTGVVMDVPVEPGQVVGAGQTVVKLAKSGAREAVISVPEQALKSLPSTASASLYSDSKTGFAAKLRELSSVADPLTRTYQAKYVLSGAGDQAPLGATVTIHTAGDSKAANMLIASPVSALVDKGDGPSVWVIDPANSTVSLRKVKVERLGEEVVSIAGGIAVGERVVAFGSHLLKPGQKVELLAPVKVGRDAGNAAGRAL